MVKKRHLPNAPITEAIIDFRVNLPQDFDVEAFATLKENLKDSYPNVKKQLKFQRSMKIQDDRLVIEQGKDYGLQGIAFQSEDSLNVAQFRMDGFTFSRLKPYTRWKDLVEEAHKLWMLYIDLSSPETVSRIAVRYINHIKTPLPVNDLSKILTAPPIVPKCLPQSVNSFRTRVVVHDSGPEKDIAVNVTQALEKNVDPKFATIILDIDAYKMNELKIDDEEIWTTFEKLHDLKNEVFFDSITEETVRLFE